MPENLLRNSNSGKMTSFEEKSDQFTRKENSRFRIRKFRRMPGNASKIQTTGQPNLFGAVDLAQISKKIQNPGKWPVQKRKVINLQEGKFKVSDQKR